jgi:dihydrofolate synthase / folylpolyglutamate synthase
VHLDDALAYLDAHINREAVAGRIRGLSLDPVRRLVGALGDPQHAYPVIHVTGTNGKGSTAHLISAALEGQGLTVGLYTSPHIDRVNERIARNRVPIGDGDLAAAIGAVAAAAEVTGEQPSYFEILTAAGLGWFAEVAVDVAVVEVGLLGAYDATNVVEADVAVVTNIGRDHTDGAGDWRRDIATEKAGIIEPGSHLVLGPVGEDVAGVFLERPARDRWCLGAEIALGDNLPAVGGRVVDVSTPVGDHAELFVPLLGEHQGTNAALAVGAAEAFFGRALDDEALQAAFAEVTVAGRAEILGRGPTVLVDAAHNPEGAAALARTLGEIAVGGRRIVVVGVLEGREPADLLDALGLARGDLVVATQPDWPRACEAVDVEAAAARLGADVVVVPEVSGALDRALSMAGQEDLVVVCGSHYTVGEARRAWDRWRSAEDDFEGPGDRP